jgi:uncharacterized protein (UPF0332 family)
MEKLNLEKFKSFSEQIVKKFGKDVKAIWLVPYQKESLLVILLNNLGKSDKEIKELVENIKIFALKLEEKMEGKEKMSVDVVLLTHYYEKLLENRLDIFAEIKQAVMLYDTGFFMPIKILVEKGEIRGTKEAMIKLIEEVRKNLNEVDYLKIEILSDIYSAVVDAAEAALFSKGVSFFIPKELPGLLKKHFLKEKRITKQTLDIFLTIYNLYKEYEHKKIKINGAELDKLIQQADFFVDQMQHITREWAKIKIE